MKKIMKIIVKSLLLLIPFAIILAIPLQVQAMSNEEKELFSLLGIEYSVDEKGNLETFLVDEKSPKVTYEQRMAFVQKYSEETKIGDLCVSTWYDEESGRAVVNISAEQGSLNISLNGTIDIYVNPNQEFLCLTYENEEATEPQSVGKGNMELDENGYNQYTEYVRNDAGEYIPLQGCDGDNVLIYDDNGKLEERHEIATKITYDAENNPISIELETNDKVGSITVPYEIKDEMQKIIDENGGAAWDDQNESDGSQLNEELQNLMQDLQMAQQLGLELPDYQERNKRFMEYTVGVDKVGLAAKAQIFGVDRVLFLNESKPAAEEEIPEGVSERGVAEELAKIINQYRVDNGLEPLDHSGPILQEVADLRATEATYVMDEGHSRPFSGNISSFLVGENLVGAGLYCADTNAGIAEILFNAWRTSPGHNANMLEELYKDGALGIEFAWVNGCLMVYASNVFSVGYFEEGVDDYMLEMIRRGPQTPESYGYTPEQIESIRKGGPNTDMIVADKVTDSGERLYEELNIVDKSGNKFQLPNGADWTYAYVDMQSVNVAWKEDGTPYVGKQGIINFSDAAGTVYSIYVYPEQVTDGISGEVTIYLNNYPEDKIVLVPSRFNTLDGIMPAGYDGNYATNVCYYIHNGEKVNLAY